jgi:hypothetical protein
MVSFALNNMLGVYHVPYVLGPRGWSMCAGCALGVFEVHVYCEYMLGVCKELVCTGCALCTFGV